MLENYKELHDTAIESLTHILNSTISEYIKNENNAENFAKLKLIQLHISHAIGELLEAKSAIMELDPMEQILKEVYEKEMDNMLKAMTESFEFDDLLKE